MVAGSSSDPSSGRVLPEIVPWRLPTYLEGSLHVTFQVTSLSGHSVQVEFHWNHGDDFWTVCNLFSQIRCRLPALAETGRRTPHLKLVCGETVLEMEQIWEGSPLASASIRKFLFDRQLLPVGQSEVCISLTAIYGQTTGPHLAWDER